MSVIHTAATNLLLAPQWMVRWLDLELPLSTCGGFAWKGLMGTIGIYKNPELTVPGWLSSLSLLPQWHVHFQPVVPICGSKVSCWIQKLPKTWWHSCLVNMCCYIPQQPVNCSGWLCGHHMLHVQQYVKAWIEAEKGQPPCSKRTSWCSCHVDIWMLSSTNCPVVI